MCCVRMEKVTGACINLLGILQNSDFGGWQIFVEKAGFSVSLWMIGCDGNGFNSLLLLTNWKDVLTNCGPLSWRWNMGILNNTIEWTRKRLATSHDVKFEVFIALVRSKEQFMMTNMYQLPRRIFVTWLGMSITTICEKDFDGNKCERLLCPYWFGFAHDFQNSRL